VKQTLKFKLFGGIHILSNNQQWIPINALSSSTVGKKQQGFLTYLLLNHSRKISSAELMENFWPGDGKDPANSLKNMIHKTRALLQELFPDREGLLQTIPGGYEWTSNVQLEVDTDIFERLYQDVKSMTMAQEVAMKLEAFELYSGDILPGENYDWLSHLNIYYKTLYIDICKSLAVQLLEDGQWNDVIRICNRAGALAPEVEEFVRCSMLALTNTGLPGEAIRQYEEYRGRLWDNFNLVPSEAVEQAYNLAMYTSHSSEDQEQIIIEQLSQKIEQMESFRCSMMVFQNFVQLELRHMARSRHAATIVILRVEPLRSGEVNATDIRRVERTLLQSLRAGDPFTRLNLGSFALLLSGATAENTHRIMERVEKNFYSTYPRAQSVLRYRVYPLEVKSEEN